MIQKGVIGLFKTA